MTAFAWRRALVHTATVRRNTTSVSASGSTTFHYADLLTGVKCSVQDDSGRLLQADVGQMGLRKATVLFAEDMLGLLQQNDLLVLGGSDDGGRVYRLTHVHEVQDLNGPHVEAEAEQYVPAGRD